MNNIAFMAISANKSDLAIFRDKIKISARTRLMIKVPSLNKTPLPIKVKPRISADK
jgi:hypothetical protein